MHFGRIGDVGDEIPAALIDARVYDLTPLTADIDGAFLAGDPVAEVSARLGELNEIPDAATRRIGAPVARPGAVYCIGLNYAAHAREGGNEPPEEIIVFMKPSNTVVGPDDDVSLPPRTDTVDWEAELAIVIGSRVRDADPDAAAAAIAGYSVLNDVTMRDYQNRTLQWLQGKTFDETAPFGPVVVTADEFAPGPRISCAVNGETVQDGATDDLVFGPAELVSYISGIVTLHPGDVIASGTPGGVGHARTPARYLAVGDRLETTVEGIGTLRNRVDVRER
jgi:acylpyruvate hydrolase